MARLGRSLFATLAIALCGVAPARAAIIDLGFIVDESGSIAATEFDIIRNGLASALGTLVPIGAVDQYRVSVVKFDDTAEVVVDRVLVTDAATRTAVAGAVAAMSQQGGTTNYTAAFNLMRTTLTAGGTSLGTAYVNFATDGEPNVDTGNTLTARNALIAAGIDNISIEGIGVTAGAATFLQNSICYPQPCDATVPFAFPGQGFYIGVANATEYASAIRTKITTVTRVPEPGTLALAVLALGALVATARRKSS